MTAEIPLSYLTKVRIWDAKWGTSINEGESAFTRALMIAAIYLSVGAMSIIFLVILPMPLSLLAILGTFVLMSIAFWLIVISPYRRQKAKILRENEEDYHLGGRVRAFLQELIRAPWDLDQLDIPEMVTIKGFQPVQVVYYPQHELESQLQGTIMGRWGLFTSAVQFQGQIVGQSTPILTSQNIVAIGIHSTGETIRLISPSLLTWKSNLKQFFNELGSQYGRDSHTEAAINAVWQDSGGLGEQLERLSAERIFDDMTVKLRHPEQSSPWTVMGIQVPSGAVLVSKLGMGDQLTTILPLGLMSRIEETLGEILPKSLPRKQLQLT